MNPPPYQATTRFIVAPHQPALVLAYARSRDVDAHMLLRGTALFEEDLLQARTLISPADYLRLLANLDTALPEADTSFMLGQQLLPGHYGAVSHALLHARNLREALGLLVRHQARLSPLLSPHLQLGGPHAVLYWTDACGSGRQRAFLVEMQMTALASLCRWLSGERLPWQHAFNRTRPRHTEQYEVHLGSALRFNCQLDAMLIDGDWLDRPWPRGSGPGAELAVRAAATEDPDGQPALSLLAALYELLRSRVSDPPPLEQAAQHFGVSPATFKRHLARHATHYQAEVDQVRAHMAVYLMHQRGFDTDRLAATLGFTDPTNFRRAFKRWTGLTPALLRAALLPGH